MVKVKICGITNIEDALLAERLGADALGFIFYKKSKRYIDPEKAGKIIRRLSPFIVKVGVFVNESTEMINKLSAAIKLNAVQLHGDEPPGYSENIYSPVIKSFRVDDNFDFSLLNNYKNISYLLDTYSQKEHGGTGNKFDWGKIPFNLRGNIILAGGISSENIEYIINHIKPAAADLSSSVEKKPGKKDEEKLKIFFNKINNHRS